MQRSGALHVTFNRIQSLVDLRAARYKSQSLSQSAVSVSVCAPSLNPALVTRRTERLGHWQRGRESTQLPISGLIGWQPIAKRSDRYGYAIRAARVQRYELVRNKIRCKWHPRCGNCAPAAASSVRQSVWNVLPEKMPTECSNISKQTSR